MKIPGERQGVTLGLFAFAAVMLFMAWDDPKLWETKLFEVILQAVVLTGLLNMVAAFHFASNKGSEVARENTGAAFRAIEATATGLPPAAPPHDGLNTTDRPAGTHEDPVHTTEEPKK